MPALLRSLIPSISVASRRTLLSARARPAQIALTATRMSSTSIPVPEDFASHQANITRPFIANTLILLKQNKVLYQPLAEADPEIAKIIEDETWRQFSGLELIASEASLPALVSPECSIDDASKFIELNLFGCYGSQWFHADQQVL